jgi:hypothetical protein
MDLIFGVLRAKEAALVISDLRTDVAND